jgi:cell wall-associated NlpC family hydrolase
VQFIGSKSNYKIIDSLTVLPQPSLGERVHGVVSISVANLRTKPSHAAEMATQVLMGTPLRVLKKQAGWYYVQTPEDYLGWTEDKIVLVSKDDYDQWVQRPKIIVTAIYGFTYGSKEKGSPVVSDVVIGSLLGLKKESRSHYEVLYPDGRTAFLAKGNGEPLSAWIGRTKDTPENILATAKRFFGIPYLWGGTSAKGFDCSGFTKTVFYLNGVLLPRDANQQATVGEPVDTSSGLENLRPGDLLFFGSKATKDKPERITHCAISLGGKRFIHESGDVRINSLDPADPDYSEFRSETFVRAKRVIGVGENAGVRRLSQISYYRGYEPK